MAKKASNDYSHLLISLNPEEYPNQNQYEQNFKEKLRLLAISYHNLSVEEDHFDRRDKAIEYSKKAYQLMKSRFGDGNKLTAKFKRTLDKMENNVPKGQYSVYSGGDRSQSASSKTSQMSRPSKNSLWNNKMGPSGVGRPGSGLHQHSTPKSQSQISPDSLPQLKPSKAQKPPSSNLPATLEYRTSPNELEELEISQEENQKTPSQVVTPKPEPQVQPKKPTSTIKKLHEITPEEKAKQEERIKRMREEKEKADRLRRKQRAQEYESTKAERERKALLEEMRRAKAANTIGGYFKSKKELERERRDRKENDFVLLRKSLKIDRNPSTSHVLVTVDKESKSNFTFNIRHQSLPKSSKLTWYDAFLKDTISTAVVQSKGKQFAENLILTNLSENQGVYTWKKPSPLPPKVAQPVVQKPPEFKISTIPSRFIEPAFIKPKPEPPKEEPKKPIIEVPKAPSVEVPKDPPAQPIAQPKEVILKPSVPEPEMLPPVLVIVERVPTPKSLLGTPRSARHKHTFDEVNKKGVSKGLCEKKLKDNFIMRVVVQDKVLCTLIEVTPTGEIMRDFVCTKQDPHNPPSREECEKIIEHYEVDWLEMLIVHTHEGSSDDLNDSMQDFYKSMSKQQIPEYEAQVEIKDKDTITVNCLEKNCKLITDSKEVKAKFDEKKQTLEEFKAQELKNWRIEETGGTAKLVWAGPPEKPVPIKADSQIVNEKPDPIIDYQRDETDPKLVTILLVDANTGKEYDRKNVQVEYDPKKDNAFNDGIVEKELDLWIVDPKTLKLLQKTPKPKAEPAPPIQEHPDEYSDEFGSGEKDPLFEELEDPSKNYDIVVGRQDEDPNKVEVVLAHIKTGEQVDIQYVDMPIIKGGKAGENEKNLEEERKKWTFDVMTLKLKKKQEEAPQEEPVPKKPPADQIKQEVEEPVILEDSQERDDMFGELRDPLEKYDVVAQRSEDDQNVVEVVMVEKKNGKQVDLINVPIAMIKNGRPGQNEKNVEEERNKWTVNPSTLKLIKKTELAAQQQQQHQDEKDPQQEISSGQAESGANKPKHGKIKNMHDLAEFLTSQKKPWNQLYLEARKNDDKEVPTYLLHAHFTKYYNFDPQFSKEIVKEVDLDEDGFASKGEWMLFEKKLPKELRLREVYSDQDFEKKLFQEVKENGKNWIELYEDAGRKYDTKEVPTYGLVQMLVEQLNISQPNAKRFVQKNDTDANGFISLDKWRGIWKQSEIHDPRMRDLLCPDHEKISAHKPKTNDVMEIAELFQNKVSEMVDANQQVEDQIAKYGVSMPEGDFTVKIDSQNYEDSKRGNIRNQIYDPNKPIAKLDADPNEF